MSITNKVYNFFFTLSKKRSRENLYEWMDQETQNLLSKNKKSPIKVINVGSGGEVYDALKKHDGIEITQVDIDPDRKPDIVASVCDMPMFDDNSIDAIYLIEVLEHVDEPWHAIPEIKRILKPGGKLVLSTPFIFPLHDEPYDFYRYTKYGLQHLLKEFDNVSIKERNSYIKSIYVLYGRMLMTKHGKLNKVGIVAFAFMLVLWPIMWAISELYDNKQATTGYFTVARK